MWLIADSILRATSVVEPKFVVTAQITFTGGKVLVATQVSVNDVELFENPKFLMVEHLDPKTARPGGADFLIWKECRRQLFPEFSVQIELADTRGLRVTLWSTTEETVEIVASAIEFDVFSNSMGPDTFRLFPGDGEWQIEITQIL